MPPATMKPQAQDDESAYPRVVRLKTADEWQRRNVSGDATLRTTLNTIAQAAEVMERMQQRCMEIESQAEAYILASRDDLRNAEARNFELERRLKDVEARSNAAETQLAAHELRIRELELAIKEVTYERDVLGGEVKSLAETIELLHSAVAEHVEVGASRLESMRRSFLERVEAVQG